MLRVPHAIALVALVALVMTGCTDVVPATNPFDPEAPADLQAKASVGGQIVLRDGFDDAIRAAQLEALRVVALQADGRAGAEPVALGDLVVEAGTGRGDFLIDELVPGSWTLTLEGLGESYVGAALPTVTLSPGEALALPPQTFVSALVDGDGPGQIAGDITVDGVPSGQHTVALFTRRGDQTVGLSSQVTGARFDFDGLVPGRYAVVVDSPGLAPAYRLDLEIPASGPQALTLEGAQGIVLHPITSVLLPAPAPEVVLDEGGIYVRGNEMPVAVLSFGVGDVGVTEMRLSDSADLLDAAGAPLPFVGYQATASVPLSREGPVTVFAQFQATSPGGFTFTSDLFTLDVVRDVTPPQIAAATIAGAIDDDGTLLLDARAMTVIVDAIDNESGVDAQGVALGGALPDAFVDVTASPGQVRLTQALVAGADGDDRIAIAVEDRAGNRSATRLLDVVVDSTVPDVALVVDNAPGGVLPTRGARLALDASAATTDLPVFVQVRVVGQPFSDPLPADGGPFDVIVPGTLDDGDTVGFEARLVDRVGNEVIVARDVTLALRGAVSGVIAAEGVPLITPSVAGATATIRRGGAVVDSVTVDAGGGFTLDDLAAGDGYVVELALAGSRTTRVAGIAVLEPLLDGTPRTTDLETITLPLARGELVGRARRGDLVGDATAHAGIAVSARLIGGARTTTASTTTDAAGAFVLSGLPATVGDEIWSVEARRDDYAAATTAAAVGDNARVDVGQLLLSPERGDFDVCRTTGPCDPILFTNEDAVRVRLRDATDAAALVVQVDDGAITTVPVAGDNLTLVSLGPVVDGEHVISIQVEKGDGTRGAALTAIITRDTVVPQASSITRQASAKAHDPRFSADQFVDVVLDADAGTGAPLAAPRLVIADTVPATPPVTGRIDCAQGAVCRVGLPGAELDAVEETLHRIHGFSCDLAGNCAAPVSTFIIHDRTAPSTTNGVSFGVDADGAVVVDEAGVAVTVLPTPLAVGSLGLGTARDGGGTDLVDEGGDAVADVFAFRFSLAEATIDRAALQTFATPPVAGELRAGADIVLPALASVTTTQTIVARVEDAAGNGSDLLFARVRVDTSAPQAIVVLNGGAPTNLASVPFTVTVPPGAEAPAELRMSVDGGAPQVFTLPIDAADRLTLGTTEGARRVTIDAVDIVGNTLRSEQIIVVDRTAPRVDAFVCVDADCVDRGVGTILTNAADAAIDLVATAFDASGVASIEVSLDGGTPRSFIGTTATQVGVTVDGSSTLSVVAIDAVGNRSAPLSRAVIHDRTPPTIASVTIDGGAARTNDLVVPVRIDVPVGDAVELRLAASTSFSGPFSAFRADETFTLSGADGARQVCVEVRDASGNASSACDTIELDRTAPAGTVAFAVATTRATTLAATVAFPADTARVAVSSTALSCAPETTPYVAAGVSPSSVSVGLGAGDGVQTVFACFEDGAGNTAQATTTILVDRTPPTAAVVIEGGATFSLDAELGVVVTPSETVTNIALAVDAALDCAAATYVPFVASQTVTVAATEGTHTVRACVEDAAGNRSAVAGVDTIVLDLLPPAGTVVIEGGAAFTRDRTVGLAIGRTTADATAMAIGLGANLDCATAATIAFSTSALIDLADSEGPQTVSVCLKDGAGRTARVTDTITLDRINPTGTIVVAGGSDTTTTREVTAALTFAADVVEIAVSAFPLSCETAVFVPPATSVSVELPFQGENTVTACLKDGAGNLAGITDKIFLEEAAGDALVIAIDGGSATARDTDALVSLFRPSSDFTTMKVVEAPTIDCADLSGYEAFASTKALTLSSGTAPFEGTRTVAACVRNPANGQTRAATDSIFIDSFAPSGTIVVNSDDDVTGSRSVSVALTNAFATETVTVALAESSTLSGGQCSGSFEAFSAQKAFTLSDVDGPRTVFACFRDAAGNTLERSDTIVLDTTPPSPVAITLPPLTSTTAINATLSFPIDAVEVVLAEGALECATASGYVATPATSPSPVPFSLAVGDGSHTVVACFRDAAGNTTQTSAVTTLDTANPTGSVVIAGGAVFATTTLVNVAISAADATGLALIESDTPPDCEAASYQAFVTATPFSLSAADGRKTIQLCLEDAAGNRAAGIPASITLDRTAPNGTLVINSGDAATRSRSVVLGLDAGVHTDVTSFAVAESTIACDAGNLAYQPFSTVSSFLLSSTDEEKTVLLCLKDAAGNTSTVTGEARIVLDTTPPAVGATPVQIQDGDGFLQAESTVNVLLSWNVQNDVARVKVAEGAVDCSADAGYVDVAANSTSATVAVAVSSGEGQKVVVACLKDAAGNTTLGQDSTTRDGSVPGLLSLTCLDCVTGSTGALFSTDASVSLGVTGTELVATALVSVDGGTDTVTTIVDGVIAVTGLSEAAHTIRVRLRDAAGNTTAVANARTIALTVDASAPSVAASAITLAGLDRNGTSAVLTRTPFITVQVTGAPADTAFIRLSEDATFAAGTQAFAPFTSTAIPFSLSATDGAKTVSVQLKDAAGNVGVAASRSITLDTTPPSATSVVIASGRASTNASTVALALTATGATQMRIETPDNAADTESFVAFATTASTVIENAANSDGEKTVIVTFRDDAGNVTTAVDTITLDQTAPTGGAVVINGGAAVTNDTTVTLGVTRGSADVVEMQVGGGAFVPFSDVVLASISSGDCAPGVLCKSVSVVLRDAAGNTQTVSDTISLDTAAPSAVSVALSSTAAGDNNGFTTTGQVSVVFTFATGAGQATLVKHGEGAVDCGTDSGYEALSTSPQPSGPPVSLSAGDGQKFYLACFKDAAGNITQASSSVVVDTLPPSGTVAINNGDGFTTSTAVDVFIDPDQDDVVEVALSSTPIVCSAVPVPSFVDIESSLPFTLVDKPVGAEEVFACFRDRAGNVSLDVVRDTIVLDPDAPSVSFGLRSALSGAQAGFTRSSAIEIAITAMSSDAAEIAVAETTIDCGTASYEPLPQPLPPISLSAPLVRSFTVSAAEGEKTVAICVRDAAGSDGSSTATITLDSTAPDVSVVINNDDDFTSSAAVSVSMTSSPGTDPLAFAVTAQPEEGCDRAFSDPLTFEPLPTSVSATVVGPDGTRSLGVCFRDRAGNVAIFTDEIEVDTQPPVVGARSCDDCNEVPLAAGSFFFSNDTVASLTVDTPSADVVTAYTIIHPAGSTTAVERACTVDAQCRAGVESCVPVPVSLTAGAPRAGRCVEEHEPDAIVITLANPVNPIIGVPNEGEQQVMVVLEDVAGNMSINQLNAAFFRVTRDVTPPTVSYDVPELSNQLTVFVSDLVATDNLEALPVGLGTFRVSGLSTFADTFPIPYQDDLAPIPLTLASGDGTKDVFVQVTDHAGNATTVPDAVKLDTTAPTTPRFNNASAVIGDPADGSDLATVTVNALALQSVDPNLVVPRPYVVRGITPPSGGCVVLTGGDAISSGDGCTWNGTTPFILAAEHLGEGENRLQVFATDTAGNASGVDTLTILVDTRAPEAPELLDVNERDGSVTFSWALDPSEDVAGYLVGYGEDDLAVDAQTGNFANEGVSPIFAPQQLGTQVVQFTLSGLTNDTPFIFRIQTVDVARNRSAAHTVGGGLTVKDAMPNPIAPEALGSIAGTDAGRRLDVEGVRAAAYESSKLCMYDLVDPTAPTKLGCTVDTVDNTGVVLHGRHAYLTGGSTATRVVNVTDPGSVPAPTIALATPLSHAIPMGTRMIGARGGGASDGQVVVLSGETALAIVDAEDGDGAPGNNQTIEALAATPRLVSAVNRLATTTLLKVFPYDAVTGTLSVNTGTKQLNFGFVRDLLVEPIASATNTKFRHYVCTRNGVNIIDADINTNPAVFTDVGAIGGVNCVDIEFAGGQLYVVQDEVDDFSRLFIYDVSDADNVVLMGRVLQSRAPRLRAVATEAGMLYGLGQANATFSAGLYTFRLTEPERMTVVGRKGSDLNRYSDVVVSGGVAYVGGSSQALAAVDIYDLKNPANPTRIDGYSPPELTTTADYHLGMVGRLGAVAIGGGPNNLEGSTVAWRYFVRGTTAIDVSRVGACSATGVFSTDLVTWGSLVLTGRNDGVLEVWNGSNLSCVGAVSLVGTGVGAVEEISDVIDGDVFVQLSSGVIRLVSLDAVTGAPTVSPSSVTLPATNLPDFGFGDLVYTGESLYVSRPTTTIGELREADSVTLSTLKSRAAPHGAIALVGGKQLVVSNAGDGRGADAANGIFGYDFTLVSPAFQVSRNQGVRAPRSAVASGHLVLSTSVSSGLQVIELSR